MLKSTVIALIVFAALGAFFNLNYTNISDGDSFYHIRHAWLYREHGIMSSEFPWVTASKIGELGADIWYGFHLFLIPFTYNSDLIAGIRIAGVFLTLASLMIYFWVLKKFRVIYPLFWSLLLFFATPDVNFRLAMVRPHIVTFSLSMLMLYFAIAGGFLNIFLTSAALAFFHISLSWISFLIIGLALAIQFLEKRQIGWRKLGAVTLGTAAGIILRPNFIGALKLAYIQVVQLAVEKINQVPIRFGSELRKADWSIFIHQFVPILILVIPAVIFLALIIKQRRFREIPELARIGIVVSLMLLILFGLITAFIARRSMDFWISYTVIFISLIFSQFLAIKNNIYKKYQWVFGALAIIMMPIIVLNTLKFSSLYHRQAVAPDKFQSVALWLKDNTQPGEIVFNTHWDNFPMLFFWNQENYYINGMDPIFQYAFDKNLYWEHYFLDVDKIFVEEGIGYTCGEIRCTAEAVTTIHSALKNDFRASYVFVEFRRNPRIYGYLESDPQFKKVFESEKREAIFQIL